MSEAEVIDVEAQEAPAPAKARTVARRGDAAHDLTREIEAAKILRANFADLIGEDEEFAADMIEGETNLNEMIGKVVEQIAADTSAVAGMDEFIQRMEARRDRHKKRIETMKTALIVGLQQSGRKSFPHALATLSLRAVPSRAEITDESLVPSKFWKANDPTLDKKAVLNALKAKETVTGAKLSEPGQTIAISWR